MAKLTTDEIIDALKEMTLLEASELVKAIAVSYTHLTLPTILRV